MDTILLTQKAGNNAIDHSQGETGVGMWKYAVGGGMDKAEGGRRETRTLLSYNLRNLDQSNCCVISNSIQLQQIQKAGVKVMAMPAPPSKQIMIMEAVAVAD